MSRDYVVEVHSPFTVYRKFVSMKAATQYLHSLRNSFPDAHITINGVDW